MIQIYIKEFIEVISYLLKNEKAFENKGYIVVSKNDLEVLLGHNKFDTEKNKLKIWKLLNWISTDEGRLTKRIYDKESGQYKPYIKVDQATFETLKKLQKMG